MSRLQDFMGKIVSFWAGIEFNGIFVGTAIRNWFVDAYIRFVVGVLEGIEDSFAGLLRPLLDKVVVPEKAKPQLDPIIEEIKNPTKQIAAMLGYSVGGTAVGGLISSTIGPYLLLLQYEMQRDADQYRLPLGSIVEARRRGWPLAHDWSTDARDQGVTTERFDTLLEITKLLIATDQLQELRRRGNLLPEEFTARMLMLGYDKDDIPYFETLKDIIPPLPDMTRFADFGAFDPTIIQLWQEYYLAPTWITEPMKKLGINNDPPDEWANRYWFSHWKQPGRHELGEMHRRFLLDPAAKDAFIAGSPGADAKQDDLVRNAYLTQGYTRFWQDLLLRLVEEPLTRVDVRRMHKLGLLTDAELGVAYRAVGYYGENNAKMVEFTKAYNQGSTTAADRDLSKSDILRMYRERLLTRLDAHAMLIELGYNEDETDYLLDLYAQETATKTRDLTLSQVKSLYQRGIRNKSQVTVFLTAFGFNAEEIIALYELWDWEKPVDEDPKENSLTTTNLRDLYKRAILTRSQANGYLLAMGYTTVDIGYIFALWDYEKPVPPTVKARDLSVSQLKQLYQQGLRSRAEVTPVLAAMGYNSLEISALFELWDYVKPAAVRVPTRSQIDKFLIEDIIDLDTWSAEYGAMGYELKYQEWYFALLMKGQEPEE